MEASTQDHLRQFIKERKFAAAAWEQRGLNPSRSTVCDRMEGLLNDMAEKLLAMPTTNYSPRACERAIGSSLASISSVDFDTEEREFICDEAARLGRIVNAKISNTLNRWLYGIVLGTLINLFRGPAKS